MVCAQQIIEWLRSHFARITIGLCCDSTCRGWFSKQLGFKVIISNYTPELNRRVNIRVAVRESARLRDKCPFGGVCARKCGSGVESFTNIFAVDLLSEIRVYIMRITELYSKHRQSAAELRD